MGKRAKRFKRAYRLQWHISNQKEQFVKIFLESLGFRVRPVGIGTCSEEMIDAEGSLPDFEVYLGGQLLFYCEVTGANKGYVKGQPVYVALSKFTKYYSLARSRPVLFIFLGFNRGKLQFAGYCYYEDLYPYAEDRRNIVKKNFYGVDEYYIATPPNLWKPLPKLAIELLPLVRA